MADGTQMGWEGGGQIVRIEVRIPKASWDGGMGISPLSAPQGVPF